MGAPLTDQPAVEAALLRSLTAAEQPFIAGLIDQASALLRTKLRSVDDRIEKFAADPDDPAGIDPDVVSGMLAQVIKRVLVNPRGLWSTTHSTGPFADSETYAGSRAGSGTPAGALAITDDDLKQILPPAVTDGYVQAGTIRTRPHHLLGPIGPRW